MNVDLHWRPFDAGTNRHPGLVRIRRHHLSHGPRPYFKVGDTVHCGGCVEFPEPDRLAIWSVHCWTRSRRCRETADIKLLEDGIWILTRNNQQRIFQDVSKARHAFSFNSAVEVNRQVRMMQLPFVNSTY